MVSDVHYIELWINKQLIELESQESLNLRINNVLFDPTKTSTTQAEYSYSFNIPSTPNNDRILDYANNLSKMNKFHARYPAEVYADGNLIFDGSLTIQKYSAKDKMYSCNLVNIKINTLEEIFGDAVMTDIGSGIDISKTDKGHWYVPFDGAPTIDSVNWDAYTNYFFPLVSYGVFQKNYVTKDEVGATYTPKHTIDKYNKWWVDSFYPSLNVVETMRKAFEWKGYSVGGSAFSDPNINWIYASCNLANDQVPIYNLGNPKFGNLTINTKWNNYHSVMSSNSNFGSERRTTSMNSTGGLAQDLKFPYERVRAAINAVNRDASEQFNFGSIILWNMMDSTNNSAVTVTVNEDSYMYEPNENLIVIPADGWYRIHLTANATLSGQDTTFTAKQWTTTFKCEDEFKRRDVSGIIRNFKDRTPFEIQLIRNYEDNVELIKGKNNVEFATGYPYQDQYRYSGCSYSSKLYDNKSEWQTECPHQDPYGSKDPTKTTDMINSTISARNDLLIAYGDGTELNSTSNNTTTSGNGSGFGGAVTRGGGNVGNFGGSRNGTTGGYKYNTYGFMHTDGYVMPYDQAVSTAFICGFSTMSNGTMAVMKDGYSWSKLSTVKNGVFADVKGLDLVTPSSDGTTTIATDYCKNIYKQSPTNFLNVNENSLNGEINCCVYLKKDDILELVAVQRDYDGQKYAVSATCDLQITAMSQRTEEKIKADYNDNDATWGFYGNTVSGTLISTTPYIAYTEFPTLLNLFNFTNKETKVSDWLSSIQKAFNLEFVMDSSHVDINTNQGINKRVSYAVDIDDRVSSDEAEAEYISYPKEMSVQYKIDTDEWGFELTVPQEYINSDDWKEHGDSGYTVIQLNDDTYETQTQNTSTNFSYTWYDNFLFKNVLSGGTEDGFSVNITIPVIAKAEYMAEGYGYDEAMKHDGYSMTQRFWYRDQVSQESVWLSSQLANGTRESVDLTYPMNRWNGFNLSYKDTEKSIVTEYFNIHPMLSSNYVTVEVYLTPEEYQDIKGGALVHYDSDLYYCSEINGYDPSGGNRTKLKLIKKV